MTSTGQPWTELTLWPEDTPASRSASQDTVTVPGHMGERTIEFIADNPGKWFFHCHHLYHMETGMARVVGYE